MIPERPWSPPFPEELFPFFHREGLSLLGVAPPEGSPLEETRYRERLAAGDAADMGYLARHASLKFAPDRILRGCRSILVAGLGYWQPSPPPRAPVDASDAPEPSGRIALYAWGRDYHRVLGDRLRRIARALALRTPEERFVAFTDATPLAERHYAEQAGVGFTGRNGLLISSHTGSWLLLGEILTTARYPPSGHSGDRHGACPPSCMRCIAACPTGALTAPYRLDARRCISYLTIENRGPIPARLRPLLGDRLFGCDACQQACPHNAGRAATTERGFLRHLAGPTLRLDEILDLRSHDELVAAFAGSPLIRAGRRGLVRTACVLAANSGSAALLPRLCSLASDDDEVVSEHAAWAASVLERGAS